jgi:hypothetical protein
VGAAIAKASLRSRFSRRRPAQQRVAVFDPLLRATVVSRKPLSYRAGADESLDRPAHLRSGSSLTWVDNRLVLIQDDANFVAIVDPDTGRADSITLPAGEGARRQFDDLRGNKKYKFDFEACCTVDTRGGPRFIAFGSGTKRRRRKILVIDRWNHPAPRVEVIDAKPLYSVLGIRRSFAGSDMNIEGALVLPGVIRLFTRGNGRIRGRRTPLNATCDISLRELLAFLEDPTDVAAPEPESITQYALGRLDYLPIGFTDATRLGRRIVYVAAAEASKDASDDGRVSGSVIGILSSDGELRQTTLVDIRGKVLREKVEGIVAVPGSLDRVYVVLDPDNPRRPSDLCEVRLRGF